MDTAPSNGHDHSHPHEAEEIHIQIDPQTGQLRYTLKNLDYMTAVQRLTLAQFFMFEDFKRDRAAAVGAGADGGNTDGGL